MVLVQFRCQLSISQTLTLASHGASTQGQQNRFLDAQNPALMKRTVLASFTDMLLLPVTIVPRTVGAGVVAVGGAVGAVGTGMVQGIAMLNPQRWVGGAGSVDKAKEYASYGGIEGEGAIFEIGEDQEEGGEHVDDSAIVPCKFWPWC